MQDGSLLRFDSHATVPADQLLQMDYTATRSERVEVSCNDTGAVGFEKHEPDVTRSGPMRPARDHGRDPYSRKPPSRSMHRPLK